LTRSFTGTGGRRVQQMTWSRSGEYPGENLNSTWAKTGSISNRKVV
jgi:hypothetical protein